jgi:predicted 3-demethylubiquinone-9 3-methyltransferase (glyoxalase superfamily)
MSAPGANVASPGRISPCLWFDDEAEAAATFYTEIFPYSKIVGISHYGEAGFRIHRKPSGSVLAVAFELDRQPFTALNGGPQFKFSEAISLQVNCQTQKEVDYFWDQLGAGGDPAARRCGWLKDRYGVSWQVVPRILQELISDSNHGRAERVFAAVMGMKKLVIAELEKAAAGERARIAR